MVRLFLSLLVVFSLFSCEETTKKLMVDSTGKSGELVVVIDTIHWNDALGNSVIECLASAQYGLPQAEPSFTLVRVPNEAFTSIFKTARSILLFSFDKTLSEPKITVAYDNWAKDQFVMNISGKNATEVAKYIQENKVGILEKFRNEELSRIANDYISEPDDVLKKLISEKFNLSLSVPTGYQVAMDSANFLWLRKEYESGGHPISQSFFMYEFPMSDSAITSEMLIAVRDSVTKRWIEGGKENTYMTHEQLVPPLTLFSKVAGNDCYVTRGLWKLENGFMGGPFVNFAFVNSKSGKITVIDTYVYAPRFDKREYLRQTEAIAATLKFNP